MLFVTKDFLDILIISEEIKGVYFKDVRKTDSVNVNVEGETINFLLLLF